MKRGGGRNQASRGKSPSYSGGFVDRRHTHAATPPNDASLSHESKSGEQKSETAAVDGVTKQLDSMLTPDNLYGSSSTSHSAENVSPHVTSRSVKKVPKSIGQTPKQFESPSVMAPNHDDEFPSLSTLSESNTRSVESIRPLTRVEERDSSSHFSSTPLVNTPYTKQESLSVVHSVFPSGKTAPEGSMDKGEHEKSDDRHKESPFDICVERSGNVVKLKSPLFAKNREKRNEKKRQESGENVKILRPGMVLLKGRLSLMDQVNLVKLCRDLGRGSGGFYQPGYHDGGKLHLKMMCLGKNWNPETSSYGNERTIDGSKPPPIPHQFLQMVTGAIQECHGYLESHSKVRNPKNVLPSMSPNICIVNFYSSTGKLGLHQDKDESQESLSSGLPVVSFSVGDSAEFLFGDERDISKAEKVLLESGDVLIFGGKARHIFHGVDSIIPNTAPTALGEETKLKPGRLNLTFREY